MLFASSVFAYVASSSNYILQFDSINMGGELSTTSNYTMQDTIGEIATGNSTGTAYVMHAGYQNLNEQYLAVSLTSSVSFPDLSTTTNTTMSASQVITVNTDNPAGYSMYIKAGASPAFNCVSGVCTPGVDFFDNYTPTGSDPDFNWSSGASVAEFGYTVEGSDTSSFFKDDGGACNSSNGNVTDKCWYNLETTDRLIAQSSTPNHTAGSPTTVKFYAQIGASKNVVEGVYRANLTLTVVPR
jgi:archaellin